MENPGVYSLANLQIGSPKSLSLLTPQSGLDGMSGVDIEANFQYGSGGTSVTAIVATSFDGGTTWRHIARFDFGTTALVKTANLHGLISVAVSAYADLSAEGVTDGLLGDRLAVLLSSVGTYVNSKLSIRASVR